MYRCYFCCDGVGGFPVRFTGFMAKPSGRGLFRERPVTQRVLGRFRLSPAAETTGRFSHLPDAECRRGTESLAHPRAINWGFSTGSQLLDVHPGDDRVAIPRVSGKEAFVLTSC